MTDHAWVIGIDEAGYGPNLGPLVQAAVGILLPADDRSGWRSFSHVARRVDDATGPDDDRLIIDDSKKVYAGGQGFDELERTVLSVLGATTFHALVIAMGCGEITIDREIWFQGDEPIGGRYSPDERFAMSERWAMTPVLAEVGTYLVLPYVTATKRFNELVDQHHSKSAVVMDRIATLMRDAVRQCINPVTADDSQPIHFLCDKLGGRHFYGPFLQDVFPDAWPVCDREGPAESRYRLMNLSREITVTFMPRADSASVPVALASMVCKTIREWSMKQFNRFWSSRIPGLIPTAGYPNDAKRYFSAIQSLMPEWHLTTDDVWRKK
jgi:hypothetical protein